VKLPLIGLNWAHDTDTKIKGPDTLNKQLDWGTFVPTFFVIKGDYYAGIDHHDLNKKCP
jgi:hypothetical protein